MPTMSAGLFLPLVVVAVAGMIALLLKSGGAGKLPESEVILQRRLHLTGIVLLAAGLPAAGLVYLKAPASRNDGGAIGYMVDGGGSYAVKPSDSKGYNYQMEILEGKEGVMLAEDMDWFHGLWHGRRLASTLAVLSVGGSLACFLLARLLLAFPPLPASPPTGKPK
jgi:hypothetical protein